MPSAKNSTPQWSSRPAFYLATVGAAVGLGSIWRLPYQVGSSGGSAFVFVFTIACLCIATPLLVAEFLIGRHSRLNPPQSAGAVAVESGLSTSWNVIGILGTIAVFAMMASYTVVASWVLAYSWKCASGALAGRSRAGVAELWHAFLTSPVEMIAWHVAFLLMVVVISARGVGRGIEIATKLRAPILLLLLVGLAAYALITGDARAGLRFAFAPNFSAITPKVILAAIGQAFYATGVGAAMMLAYGAYVAKGTSLVRGAIFISLSIFMVSLLATLTIFPLVFHYGMNPAQGPDLVFDVLATVFAEMPGGRLVGTLFFVLLVFAAITPTIAGFEPVVAWLQQRWRLPRARAVIATVGGGWLFSVGGLLSPKFFAVMDFVPPNIMLPLGALATSIFVGWRISRAILATELAETTPFAARCCIWALRYLCPIAIGAVFVAAVA